MTKIDFYILSGESREQRHTFACRLAEKAFKLGNRIYIHSDDSAQANTLDDLLWTWKRSSFVPHHVVLDDSEKHSVAIGFGDTLMETSHNNLMINLSTSVPEFFSRFDRVAEIVVKDASITESTRANYRFYRHRGYLIEDHHLQRS